MFLALVLWSFVHVVALVIATLACFAWKRRGLGWIGTVLTLASIGATLFYMAVSFGNHPPEMQSSFVFYGMVLVWGSLGAALILGVAGFLGRVAQE